MIAIELAGGLGNLMFEYAFIYSTHKRLKTSFFLIKSGTPILLYEYFIVHRNPFYYIDLIFFNHDGYKLFFSHYLKGFFTKLFIKSRLTKKIKVDNREEPAEALKRIRNNVIYEGYFQSEAYFKPHAAEIKKLFTIKPRYVRLFAEKFAWLKKHKRVVTVHIRRTDYTTAFEYLDLGGCDLTLPFSYYHQLIQEIDQPENFYVIISDDIATVRSEFDYLPNKYFSNEPAIIDFQLMQHADVCILANSSFSWWAAYLNPKAAQIYCPTYYLGFLKKIEYPNQIYPSHWIQVPVH